MRRMLDRIYDGSEYVAAACVVAICAFVSVQVVFNTVDKLAAAFHLRPIGLVVPSYSEFTGYFLAAASFFALAGALRRAAHIRVALVLDRMGPVTRHWAEVWSFAIGVFVISYFSFWSFALVLESYRFNDISPGMVAIPLWVPQLSMAVGSLIFAVALADGLATRVMHGESIEDTAEQNADPVNEPDG